MNGIIRSALLTAKRVARADGGTQKPLRLYHGTEHSDPIDELNPHISYDQMGIHLGDAATANRFAQRMNYDPKTDAMRSPRVIPFDAKLDNPLRLQDKHGTWMPTEVYGQLVEKGLEKHDPALHQHLENLEQGANEEGVWNDTLADERQREAQKIVHGLVRKHGYDGIVYLNRYEMPTDEAKGRLENHPMMRHQLNKLSDEEFKEQFPEAVDSYIAFDPKQLQSPFGAGRGVGYADGGEVDGWHHVHEEEAQHFANGGDAEPPQQTIKAYKLFRTKKTAPGKLFPLFVNANDEVPVGKWVQATAGAPGKNPTKVKSSLGDLAYRPGWHAGDLPIATHIGGRSTGDMKKPPDYRPANQVWAEVEMPADVDWQSVANSRVQYTKDGRPIASTAHITDQVPYGGHYRYKTNPNMTGNWIIGGGMKVNRVLSDDEVQAINDAAGVADLPRHPDFPKKADGGDVEGGTQNDPNGDGIADAAAISAQARGFHPDRLKELGSDWQDATVIDHEGNVIHNAINGSATRGTQKAVRLHPDGSMKKGFIAYHGSPHDFEKFDLSKIGTGEGAQAYGHGLYFAESEPVAVGYRNRISKDQGQFDIVHKKTGQIIDQNNLAFSPLRDFFKTYGSDLRSGDVKNKAENLNRWANELDGLIAEYAKDAQANPDYADEIYKEIDKMRSQQESYRAAADLLPHTMAKPIGKMYQTHISADPEHFLDWDKPLSEQSKSVRQSLENTNAFREQKYSRPDDPELLGRIIYDDLVAELEKKENVSAALKSAGIPGIKYLDAGSRNAGDGTRNYVLFDDKLVDVLKKYRSGGFAAGENVDKLIKKAMLTVKRQGSS